MRRIVKLFPKVGGELIIDDVAHSLSINIELEDSDEITISDAIASAAWQLQHALDVLREKGHNAYLNERVIVVSGAAPSAAPRRDDEDDSRQSSGTELPAKPKGSQSAGHNKAICYALKKIQSQNGMIGYAFVDEDGEDIHDPALKMFNTQFNNKHFKKLSGLTGLKFDLQSDKGVGNTKDLPAPIVVTFKEKDNGYVDVVGFEAYREE